MSHLNPDPLLQDSELPLCPWCNQPYRKWHDNCQRRDVHHVWELGIQPDESRGLMRTHAERMKAAAEEHIKQRDLRASCGTAEEYMIKRSLTEAVDSGTAASSSGSNDRQSMPYRRWQKWVFADYAEYQSSGSAPSPKKQRRDDVQDAD